MPHIKIEIQTSDILDEHIFVFENDDQMKSFMTDNGFGPLYPGNLVHPSEKKSSEEDEIAVIVLGDLSDLES